MSLSTYLNLASSLSSAGSLKKSGLLLAGGLGAAFALHKTFGGSVAEPIDGAEVVHEYPAVYKAVVFMKKHSAANEYAYRAALDCVDRLLVHYRGCIDSPYATANDVTMLTWYLSAYEAWSKALWDSHDAEVASEIRERYIASFEMLSNLIARLMERLRKRAAISYHVKVNDAARA